MSAVFSLPRLPSSSPPFSFSDATTRKILSSSPVWFLHVKGTGRVHGPFQTVVKSGRILLKGSWRRGLPAGKNSYIRLAGRKTLLSPGQEKCLLADLALLNRPQIVPDVWQFGLSSGRLRVSVVTHRPFSSLTAETRVDPLRIKRLSSDILSSLLLIRRSGLRSGWSDLKTAGRLLFRTLLPDRDLTRLLEEGMERTTLLVPERSLETCPLEFLHAEDFLCLTRPVSRSPQTSAKESAEQTSVSCENPVFRILYGGSTPPASAAELSSLFRSYRQRTEILRITQRNLPGLLSGPAGVHFIGHGTVRAKSYLWQSLDRLQSFPLTGGQTPGFIFSQACNRAFFSPLFADLQSDLLSSGTETWVGAWSETDLDSPVFAAAFYSAFLSGLPAAESVLSARRSLLSRNAGEALLFGCRGNPMKKIPSR